MKNKKTKQYKPDINSNIKNENALQINKIKSNIKSYEICNSPKNIHKFKNDYDNSSSSNEISSDSILLKMEKKMILNLQKYNGNDLKYRIRKINEIIFNLKKRIVAVFKDYLFYYEPNDFFTYYYNLNETKEMMTTITEYYTTYLVFIPNHACLFDFKKILNKYYKKKKKLLPDLSGNESSVFYYKYKFDFTPLIKEDDIKESSFSNNLDLFYNKYNDLASTITLSYYNDNKNSSQKLSEILSKLSENKIIQQPKYTKTNYLKTNKNKINKKSKIFDINNCERLYFKNKKEYFDDKNVLKETTNANIDLNYLKNKIKKYFPLKFNTINKYKSLQNTSRKNEFYIKNNSPFKIKNRLTNCSSKRSSNINLNINLSKKITKSPRSCHNKDVFLKKKIFSRNINNDKSDMSLNRRQIQKTISLKNTISINNNDYTERNYIIRSIKNKWIILNKNSNKNILVNNFTNSFKLRKKLITSQSTKNYLAQSEFNKPLKKINKSNDKKLKSRKISINDTNSIKTICVSNMVNDNSKFYSMKHKKVIKNYNNANNENTNHKKNNKIKLMKSNTIKNFQLNRKIGYNNLVHNFNNNDSNNNFICNTNSNSLKKLFQKKILLHINKKKENSSNTKKIASLIRTNKSNYTSKTNTSKNTFEDTKIENAKSFKNIHLNKNYIETEYINKSKSKIMNKKKLIPKTRNTVLKEVLLSTTDNNISNKNKNLQSLKGNFGNCLKVLKK